MGFGREPVDVAALLDQLVCVMSVVLAVVAVILAAAVELHWTPVCAPAMDLTTDPAGHLPF